MTLTALKIFHLEQLNNKIFALLSTIFSRLKIEHLIKQIGIKFQQLNSRYKKRPSQRMAFYHLKLADHAIYQCLGRLFQLSKMCFAFKRLKIDFINVFGA